MSDKPKPEKPRAAAKERHYGLPISSELEQEIADVAVKAAKVGMSTAGLRQLVGHRVSDSSSRWTSTGHRNRDKGVTATNVGSPR